VSVAGLNKKVVGSARRSEGPAVDLRVGVHGTRTAAGTAVLGEEVDTIGGGGGDDVRRISAAAAVMGAAALTLLLPSDTRRGCVPTDE